jgi:4-hydroxy-3-polyprenylbenzoate decarboxylase
MPGRSALIVSDAALRVFRSEIDPNIRDPEHYLSSIFRENPERMERFDLFNNDDSGAPPASGSAGYGGMIIVPCSMKTLSAVAHGHASNLMERAADVCLKERRRLILVPRETPYSLIHLRNMTAITEAGGIILPASPGFYHNPKSIDDLTRFISARILSLLGLTQDLLPLWRGDHESA